MKIDLSGKSALVSTSSARIGMAVADGLAEAGADTIAHGRKQEAVDRAIAKIREAVPKPGFAA